MPGAVHLSYDRNMADVRPALPSRAARVRQYLLSRSVVAQLLVLEGGILAVVLIGLSELDAASHTAFMLLKLVVASSLCFYAIYGLIEAIAAFRMRQPPPGPELPLPSTTAIVPAYLPNEAEIIMETARHHLATGPRDLQLIVAYNTPTPLPVETELLALAQEDPRLTVLRVDGSRSKAANINAAIEITTGDVVGVFDADHHPAPGSFERAWRWLADGADVVQGRCAVRQRTGRRSILSMAVTAEFEEMYAVGHSGRTKVMGIGLFGGSNGFWRAETLRRVRFDPTALTEDIDASVRLLRSGGRVVTDPSIVSTELPPPGIVALCNQRLRWAQGWFQVSRRHLAAVSVNPSLPGRVRFGIFWLFGLGTILPWVAAVGVPLTIHGWLDHDVSPLSRIIAVLFMFGSGSFILHVSVAFRHSVARPRRLLFFGTYIAANFVFYAYLRVALVRLAHLHEVAGRFEWRVTPRSAGAAVPAVVGIQQWSDKVASSEQDWVPAPSTVPVFPLAAATAVAVEDAAAPFGEVLGVRSFTSILFNRALDRVSAWDRTVRGWWPTLRTSGASRARRTIVGEGDTLVRLTVLGFVATLAILLGVSQPGSPFTSTHTGSWFFGTGPSSAARGLPPVFGIAAVLFGLLLFVRVWVGVVRHLRANPGTPLRRLATMFMLWALPVMIAPPLFSADVYSYQAQGEMVSHGINPYAYGPVVLGAYPDLTNVPSQWASTPTPSGPLFLGVDGLLTELSGHAVVPTLLLLRLLELLGVLLLAVCVPVLARSFRRDPALAFAMVLLNPLTLLQLLGGAHNDALMIGLLVAGITMARRNRPWAGVLLCALAGAVKAPALLGVLYIGWEHAGLGATPRERGRSMAKAGGIAAVVLGALTWVTGLGWGWITNLATPGRERALVTPTTMVASTVTHLAGAVGIQASMTPILLVVRLVGFGAALLLARSLLLRSATLGPVHALALTLLAFVLLGPLVQPWYLAWGLLVLAPISAGWLRSAVVGLSVAATFVGLSGGRQLVDALIHSNPVAAGIALLVLLAAVTLPVTRTAPLAAMQPPPSGDTFTPELVPV